MGIKEADVIKVRFLVIAGLVLTFVGGLIALKMMAAKLGISGGEPPLLSLVEKEMIVDVYNLDDLNKALGKKVVFKSTVDKVFCRGHDKCIFECGKVFVELDRRFLSRLKKLGFVPKNLEGMKLKVNGFLKIDPQYGFFISHPFIEIESGRRG